MYVDVMLKDGKPRRLKHKLVQHLEKAGKQVTYMTRHLEAEKPAIRITTEAKKIAEEKGLDLSGIEGTGKDGKITKKDVSE